MKMKFGGYMCKYCTNYHCDKCLEDLEKEFKECFTYEKLQEIIEEKERELKCIFKGDDNICHNTCDGFCDQCEQYHPVCEFL